MSRIAGVLVRDAAMDPDRLQAFLLGGLCDLAQRHSSSVGAGRGRLSWCGPRPAPQVVARGPLSVALDGLLFGHSLHNVLDLFEQGGMRAVLEQLNGDFALAILDTRS